MNSVSNLVRKCFAAQDAKEKKTLEALLSDDSTFSSPLDDNIDRREYFRRCWPNTEHHHSVHIEKLFAEGNEAFVTYKFERTDGTKVQNTEFFRSDGDKINHVYVYFGRDTAEGR